ncbi:PREDICTED: uncharacterized protein LOC104824662 [Tarenaya hassleriana]|uniref:uncharacterized protein LOC104824662 n=1 Tax=Tarenaya hassleriana TaxID=28532 RepID=UPI0008FCF84E|nr:PREDICTED: uncharacterized protein LOC104824662 [Tarenaya hassleriana]
MKCLSCGFPPKFGFRSNPNRRQSTSDLATGGRKRRRSNQTSISSPRHRRDRITLLQILEDHLQDEAAISGAYDASAGRRIRPRQRLRETPARRSKSSGETWPLCLQPELPPLLNSRSTPDLPPRTPNRDEGFLSRMLPDLIIHNRKHNRIHAIPLRRLPPLLHPRILDRRPEPIDPSVRVLHPGRVAHRPNGELSGTRWTRWW